MAEEMALKRLIAEREGLTPRHVLIGDGSSEILHIAAMLAAPGELVTATPTTVLVDEAYLELASDMAQHSVVDRVRAGDRVIIARTFSKLHGLAGRRIGYALASPEIIERMARLKLVSANHLGLVAAAASYNDLAFQNASRANIAAGVAITTAALDELKLRYAPTKANFVFFDTGQPTVEFLAAMRRRGFSLGRPFPPFATWCRVSMDTIEQMQQFVAALRGHYGR